MCAVGENVTITCYITNCLCKRVRTNIFQLDKSVNSSFLSTYDIHTLLCHCFLFPRMLRDLHKHIFMCIFLSIHVCLVENNNNNNKISGPITSLLCQVSTKHPFHTHNSVHTSFVSSVTRLVSLKKQVLLPGAR